jgi:bacterial/archaeal transporter family-2 protein
LQAPINSTLVRSVGDLQASVVAFGVGLTALAAVTIAGTFAVAMIVDHFGWIGVERQPITLTKLAGLGLVAAGTWLIVSD